MSVINKTIINAIDKAFGTEANAIGKVQTATDATIQKAVDCMLVACKVSKAEFMKGNSKSNAARAEVKEMFEYLSGRGHFSPKSAQQYASCFWLAFETGQQFSRAAVNKKSAEKKGSDAGRISTTTFDQLVKTLQKALMQARLLGQDELASDLLDCINEHVDGFEEVEVEA